MLMILWLTYSCRIGANGIFDKKTLTFILMLYFFGTVNKSAKNKLLCGIYSGCHSLQAGAQDGSILTLQLCPPSNLDDRIGLCRGRSTQSVVSRYGLKKPQKEKSFSLVREK